MNVVPKEKLIEMGTLHLKTNERLERLSQLSASTITVSSGGNDGYYLVNICYVYKVKSGRINEQKTAISSSFCGAIEDLYRQVFGEENKKEDTSVDARLTRIEDALETLANKIKE